MEHLKQILFIDIETVPCVPSFDSLSDGLKEQWVRKASYLKPANDGNNDPATLFDDRAGVFSEFAKVVCIGIGCLVEKDGSWKIVLKSITGDDEKVLLKQFCEALGKFSDAHKEIRFCGHNIKEFDIPFLCRRMVIQGMPLPDCLLLQGKKPWEITHIDTLELWRFGDYKHYTSLALLAEVLGIPSPKEDIDGSMVGIVYWNERDLERIAHYCMRDVLTTAKIFLRLKGLPDIAPEPQYI